MGRARSAARLRQGQDLQPSQFAVRSSGDGAPRERPVADVALGRVVSVSGSRAVVAVGSGVRRRNEGDPLSVGKLLAIEAGRSWTGGLIYAAEAAGPTRPNTMLASIELQGEIRPADTGRGTFDRGIRTYPQVGAAVH